MVSKVKWLIFTVLIGLTPVLARFIIYLISSQPAPRLHAGDVIGFGLIMVITNINFLEHQQEVGPSWKTTHIGISLILAVLFAALFTAMCVHDINSQVMSIRKIKVASLVLAFAALTFSYAVVDRLSRTPKQEEAQ